MATNALIFTIAGLLIFFAISNAAPDVLLAFLLLTARLGFPLLLANTALLYLLAAAPALFLLDLKPRNWVAIALTLLVVPAVALGPPFVTEHLAANKMQELRANDLSGRFAAPPKSVEIVGNLRSFGRNDPLNFAPCEALCQRLLLSGQVDVVRVTRAVDGRVGPVRRMEYVIERRDNCPNAFGDGAIMTPSAKNAMVSDVCFIARAPDASLVAARVVVRNKSLPGPKDLNEDLASASGALRDVKTVEIFTETEAGWRLELRQTEVGYSHWAMPLYLFYAPCYGMCMGKPVFGKVKRTLNAFDTDDLVMHALHVEPSAPVRGLTPAEQVMAMLDRAGTELMENQKGLITTGPKA